MLGIMFCLLEEGNAKEDRGALATIDKEVINTYIASTGFKV